MNETMNETTVTYTLEHNGQFYIIEHVPARICLETGEPFFSPETIEHIQRTIHGRARPVRTLQTPVFEYT